MMHEMPAHMIPVWLVALLIAALTAFVLLAFLRSAPRPLSVSEQSWSKRLLSNHLTDQGQPWTTTVSTVPQDTIFILPDISNYTRFMTGNRFAVGHAQHIVFSLINAMIEAASSRLELSKLEGDAALFYVDADKYSPEEIGDTVLDIFRAFFRQQRQLIASNICPCSACSHISMLDLKIFVHRGDAARFEFRGSIDHFGTDVIVIHRLMKNGATSKRYVMVTDNAASSIALPRKLEQWELNESHDHIGQIGARVFELGDTLTEEIANQDQIARPRNRVRETVSKLTRSRKAAFSA